MELPRYQISTNDDQTVFKFTSIGRKGNIIKIVIYSEMNEHGMFNLALGDYDPETDLIDFDTITDNGDRDMILASVSETVYAFLSKRPDCIIHFIGSDTVRTRLYQMAISNYIEELSEDFEVYGKLNQEIIRFT